MHKQSLDQVTDSMRMFEWGMEGGKSGEGKIGVQPEWFCKGSGVILRGRNDLLDVPAHADDGDQPLMAARSIDG